MRDGKGGRCVEDDRHRSQKGFIARGEASDGGLEIDSECGFISTWLQLSRPHRVLRIDYGRLTDGVDVIGTVQYS